MSIKARDHRAQEGLPDSKPLIDVLCAEVK